MNSSKDNPPLKKEKTAEEALSLEEKMRSFLDLMKQALSRNDSPQFKEFWEIRKELFPLFKEKGVSFVKNQMWKEFIDLSEEAKNLKRMLEEQSLFAVEQIELALRSLEQDLQEEEKLLQKMEETLFSEKSKTLSSQEEKLALLQKEIHLLSVLAQKLQSLRKEVANIPMRMKQKNEFFKKMGEIGDILFPKRREKMEALSALFKTAVFSFIEENKKGEKVHSSVPFYVLLQEIKAMQSHAKEMSLTPEVFLEIRESLSRFWDILKKEEKERKKASLEKREEKEGKRGSFQEKITLFSQKCLEEKLSLKDLEKERELLEKDLQTLSLPPKEMRSCREELRRALDPFYEKLKKQIQEKEEKKQKMGEGLKKELEALLEDSSEEIEEKYKALVEGVDFTSLEGFEALYIRHLVAHVEEKLLEKENSSDMLEKRRNASKERFEMYRKTLASSNLDFSTAFLLQDMVEAEKALLEKLSFLLEE